MAMPVTTARPVPDNTRCRQRSRRRAQLAAHVCQRRGGRLARKSRYFQILHIATPVCAAPSGPLSASHGAATRRGTAARPKAGDVAVTKQARRRWDATPAFEKSLGAGVDTRQRRPSLQRPDSEIPHGRSTFCCLVGQLACASRCATPTPFSSVVGCAIASPKRDVIWPLTWR